MEGKHLIIDNRFKLRKKLGEGSFGDVYKAFDITTKEHVAVKFETSKNHQQFANEIQALSSLSHIEGIPKPLSTGHYNSKQYIALELLGVSLDSKFKKYNNKFSLNCVTLIGLQMFKRLQNIHDMNYIHRDIKPSNIMIGRRNKGDNLTLYLIDFGLSKKYRDPLTKQHSLYGEKRQIIGNLKYSSLNAHLGIEQSRRDDLEACFNVLINCLKGRLPWECLEQDISNYYVVGIMKKITVEQICQGCPSEFVEILKYIRNLHFQDRPNYDYILELLNKIRVSNNFVLSFDWNHKSKRRVSNDFLAASLVPDKNVRRASAQIVLSDIQGLTKHNNKRRGSKRPKDSDSSNDDSISSCSPGISPIRLSIVNKEMQAVEDEKKEHEKENDGSFGFETPCFNIKVTFDDMKIEPEPAGEEENNEESQAICRQDTIKDSSYPEFHDRTLLFSVKD